MHFILSVLLFFCGMKLLCRSLGWFGEIFEKCSDFMDGVADFIEGIAYFLTNHLYSRHNGRAVFLEQYSTRQVCAGAIQTIIWGFLLFAMFFVAVRLN